MNSVYPYQPGSKGPDGTSQAAAVAMARSAQTLRRRALATLNQLGVATSLEVVEAAKVLKEALQPRLSELRALGLVEPTGERRRNPSGKSASVLRLTDRGRAALAEKGGRRPDRRLWVSVVWFPREARHRPSWSPWRPAQCAWPDTITKGGPRPRLGSLC